VSDNIVPFFRACAEGDLDALRGLLANDPALVRASNTERLHQGWTGLHAAAEQGHVDAVRLLLEHGADPNAREAGDNTYPLHWASAHGHTETVRALLDAGGDVHGIGDVHELDAIGWAAAWGNNLDVVSLLVERGARHHIFSAIAVGDLELIRRLVQQDPAALDRRMSRFEQGQPPMHFAMSRKRYDVLDLLIELDAELEAKDKNGHTALAVAMMRGDLEAMRRLHAAGAKGSKGWTVDGNEPEPIDPSSAAAKMARLGDSIKKGVPMISVPDIAATLDWYVSLGFTEIARYEDDGVVNFGMVSFGNAELMLSPGGKPGPHDVSLWLYTDQVDRLYELLKSRQLEAAEAALAGGGDEQGDRSWFEFVEDIYDPFYGGRQFSIRDLNGYTLIFLQPER